MDGFVDFLYQLILDAWSVIQLIIGYLQAFVGWIVQSFIPFILSAFQTIGQLFVNAFDVIKKGWNWLTHFAWHTVWNALQRWYNRFKGWSAWFKKHLIDPVEQIRKNVLAIYNQYFKPVIKVLETIRHLTDIIFFFNKKLARKLDAFFFKLEGEILTPITFLLRRVNGLSSLALAIVTETGRFDATIFIETLQKQLKDARKAIGGFPWQEPVHPAIPAPPRAEDIRSTFTQFVEAEAGDYADISNAAKVVFDDTWERMS